MRLIDDVEKALKGMLEPTIVEVIEGRAEIRQVFAAGKGTKVAGCYVTEGKISRNLPVRVIRKGKVLAIPPLSACGVLKMMSKKWPPVLNAVSV